MSLRRHSAKVVVGMVILYLRHHFTYNFRVAWLCMPCFPQTEGQRYNLKLCHTVEKCDFLQPIIHSQIINSLLSVISIVLLATSRKLDTSIALAVLA